MLRVLFNNESEKEIKLPSSKSVTHRIVILASLNKGKTTIYNPLISEDTKITIEALKSFGAEIEVLSDKIVVSKPIGKVHNQEIFLGNSGSSARFLIPLASFLDKSITFSGSEELQKRPFSELITILENHGISIKSNNKTLPITIYPSLFQNSDEIQIAKIPSSQIVTGLLFATLLQNSNSKIAFLDEIPSFPYLKMTIKMMKNLAINLDFEENRISIPKQNINFNWNYTIENDLSAASYWVAFALINQTKVTFRNCLLPSLQGDEKIFEIAEKIGGKVIVKKDSVEISGKIEKGLDFDCENIPDIVPTLAILGMFAPEKFVLRNVSRLKYKESDRISAIIENIILLGGKAEYLDENLIIFPQKNYFGNKIKTFKDHRIAMAFAIAGTKIPNVVIENPEVVEKSYPNFWLDFSNWEKVE